MKKNYTKEQLDELRREVTIERYLHHRGIETRGNTCICPFHEESRSSFFFDDLGWRDCHNGGRSGDVFQLAIELDNLTFPESVAEIARIANNPLLEVEPSQYKKTQSTNKPKQTQPLVDQTEFYKHCIAENQANNYVLVESLRGISRKTQQKFNIGLCMEYKHKDWKDDHWQEWFGTTPRIIVPLDKNRFFARDMRDASQIDDKFWKNYTKLKFGKTI